MPESAQPRFLLASGDPVLLHALESALIYVGARVSVVLSADAAEPFHVACLVVRVSPCIAVAASQGRSPVILLRELEGALALARESGPETIQSASDCPAVQSQPVASLSATSEDHLLAW